MLLLLIFYKVFVRFMFIIVKTWRFSNFIPVKKTSYDRTMEKQAWHFLLRHNGGINFLIKSASQEKVIKTQQSYLYIKKCSKYSNASKNVAEFRMIHQRIDTCPLQPGRDIQMRSRLNSFFQIISNNVKLISVRLG